MSDPWTLEPIRNGSKRREVTQMSKKKLARDRAGNDFARGCAGDERRPPRDAERPAWQLEGLRSASYVANGTLDTTGNATGTLTVPQLSVDYEGTHYSCVAASYAWQARAGA